MPRLPAWTRRLFFPVRKPYRKPRRHPLARPLLLEPLEDHILLASSPYLVPGAVADSVPVHFHFARDAGYNNELGAYLVDDDAGRVGTLLPGQPGYSEAALRRADVVFASGAGDDSAHGATYHGGDRVALLLVQNGTISAALAENPGDSSGGGPLVFFGWAEANPDGFDHARGSGATLWTWEDLTGGGDRDFNDAVVSVGLDDGSAGPAVRVPGEEGQAVATTVTLTGREAAFHNEVDLFLVDDINGWIGTIQPGDPGYAMTALTSPSRRTLFSGTEPEGAVDTFDLPAGRYFGLYLVQNATSADVLLRPAGQRPAVFFLMTAANPDGVNHVRRSGNVFGFEDLTGGGDRDFNDMVLRVDFEAPQGGPTPSGDTTPPDLAA